MKGANILEAGFQKKNFASEGSSLGGISSNNVIQEDNQVYQLKRLDTSNITSSIAEAVTATTKKTRDTAVATEDMEMINADYQC